MPRRHISSYAVSDVRGTFSIERRDDGGEQIDGTVATPHGYVHAASDMLQVRGEWRHWTQIHFIWRGRAYWLYEKRSHTQRGLSILAGRFARDVVAGRVQS